MRIIIHLLLSTLFFLLVAYIVPGIDMNAPLTAVVVAVIFAVVSFIIKPVVKLITLPINILTLGIFGLIINVLLFWLVAWVVPGFTISNFWAAAGGTLLYSLLQTLVYGFD
jgi:putative membrane protein